MIATSGEALVDLIEQPDGRFQACPGGSVFNFSVGLARQGLTVTYLNPLSDDNFGRRFLALLTDSGVRSGAAASACPTSLAVVALDEHGTPTYAFHRERVADRDATAETLVSGFPDHLELLHTGGLALVPDDIDKTRTLVAAAAARGARISVDANLRPQAVGRRTDYAPAVLKAIRSAHIVKVSDEDLVHLGLGAMAPMEAARTLFRAEPVQLVALTRSHHGAALITRTHCVELPAPAGLHVVDTVGAGDCFHAGLIAWLYRAGKLGRQTAPATLDDAGVLRGALRHAMSAASLNIMRQGCDPPTWEQTERFSLQWHARSSDRNDLEPD